MIGCIDAMETAGGIKLISAAVSAIVVSEIHIVRTLCHGIKARMDLIITKMMKDLTFEIVIVRPASCIHERAIVAQT